jgi:hypothetical protein
MWVFAISLTRYYVCLYLATAGYTRGSFRDADHESAWKLKYRCPPRRRLVVLALGRTSVGVALSWHVRYKEWRVTDWAICHCCGWMADDRDSESRNRGITGPAVTSPVPSSFSSIHQFALLQPPRGVGRVCHNARQYNKHQRQRQPRHWEITTSHSYRPPAPPRHRPRTRRQTLQNLHLLPELETPHINPSQVTDDTDDDGKEKKWLEWRRHSSLHRVRHRARRVRRSGRITCHDADDARGSLPSGRRVGRARHMDVPTHHGGILSGQPDADAARTHAPAPACAPAAIPVFALRGRPRRAHASSSAGRALALEARCVALRDAQRGQRVAREADV